MGDLTPLTDAQLAAIAAWAAAQATIAEQRSLIEGLVLSYQGFTMSLGYDWEETRKLPALWLAERALAPSAPGPTMRGETTEEEAIVKAWNSYVHDRLGVFILPNVPPNVSDYFRAGFAAGVAHASTTADPARLARLTTALETIRDIGMDEQGITRTTTVASAWECERIARAALLGPDDAS